MRGDSEMIAGLLNIGKYIECTRWIERMNYIDLVESICKMMHFVQEIYHRLLTF